MKKLSFLIFVLVAGAAQAGPRLGVASYGQTGSMSGYGQAGNTSGYYGQTATMGSNSSGKTQGYSAGGVNADLGQRYSAAGARAHPKGDTATSDSEVSYSQPSRYQPPGSSALQQPKASK